MAIYTGTNGADSMTMGADNDTMKGRDGDDTLNGAGGKDNIDGGAGDDLLIGGGNDGFSDLLKGGDGNDRLVGSFGDVLQGGDGRDYAIINISGAPGPLVIDASLMAANGSGQVKGSLNGVNQAAAKVTEVEALEVVVGASNDHVTLGDLNGLVFGNAGNDTVIGSTQNDYIRGDAGNDSLDGGAGYDRAGYSSATKGVVVSLALQGAVQNTGGGGKDFLTGFEALSGTFFADKLTGDGLGNWLWGLDGADTLIGGGGNDLFSVGNGDHKIYGDDGLDIVSFWGNGAFTIGAVCNLNVGAAQATGHGMMTLKSIERLSGSGADDVFIGSKANNDLVGDWGSDSINGGGGTDFLSGDSAIDSLFIVGYSAPPAFIPARPDTDYFDPDLSFQDTLNGGEGADTLVGGAWNDTLTGGKGADTFQYWSHRESVGAARDLITDLNDAQDIIDLSVADAIEGTPANEAFVLVEAFTNTAGQAMLTWVGSEGYTLLSLDVNGDSEADAVIQLDGRHDDFTNFVL